MIALANADHVHVAGCRLKTLFSAKIGPINQRARNPESGWSRLVIIRIYNNMIY